MGYAAGTNITLRFLVGRKTVNFEQVFEALSNPWSIFILFLRYLFYQFSNVPNQYIRSTNQENNVPFVNHILSYT